MSDTTSTKQEVYDNIVWAIFQNDDDHGAQGLAREAIQEALETAWPELLTREGKPRSDKVKPAIEFQIAQFIGNPKEVRDEDELGPVADKIIEVLETSFGKLPGRRTPKKKPTSPKNPVREPEEALAD